MPPRKRRAPEPDPEDEDEEVVAPSARRRRPSTPVPDNDHDNDNDNDDEENVPANTQGDFIDKLARKLVRYALSCEFSRVPIRRTDIVTKVLNGGGAGGGRGGGGGQGKLFKSVLQEAQLMLQGTFGMEMKELPGKEKVSVRERRAEAQKGEKQAPTGTQVWILTSTLPSKYRAPSIVPAQDPAYVGLYTFIIATILLAGGTLPETKMERYLRRTNANITTPVGTNEKLFQRMIKEQYIIKIKDTSSGEDIVEYRVGPRGKVEVGKEGVADFVRSVFGNSVEDLEKRLVRSLELTEGAAAPAIQVHENVAANGSGSTRRQAREEEKEDDASGSDE